QVGALYAGEEVTAVGGEGEWLHLRLYEFDEELNDEEDNDDHDEDEDGEDDDDDDDDGDQDGDANERGGSRNSRERSNIMCQRSGIEHLSEPLVWALRRTASRELLRPGPCIDSPSIAWDGLELDRLPMPVDRANRYHGQGHGRTGAPPSRTEVMVLEEGAEMVVVEEVESGGGHVWLRLETPVEGWVGRRGGALIPLDKSSQSGGGDARRQEGGSGEVAGGAAEARLAEEVEDCLEVEAGVDLYRRDERMFGSRQGWTLPSASCLAGVEGLGSAEGLSRVTSERRAMVIGHPNIPGGWATVASLSLSSTKEKLASTASMLVSLHCRQLLLKTLLQCHTESQGQEEADEGTADNTTIAASSTVGAGEEDVTAVSSIHGTVGSTTSTAAVGASSTRATAHQLVVFLRLVLFRGWRPIWWPLANGGGSQVVSSSWNTLHSIGEGEGGGDQRVDRNHEKGPEVKDEDGSCPDGDEPASECFHALPVVLTPLFSSLLGAARAASSQEKEVGKEDNCVEEVKGNCGHEGREHIGVYTEKDLQLDAFGAQLEEALLQSVAGQLRQASRQGYVDESWGSSDTVDVDDAYCVCQPRLPFVRWATRVVQKGSGVWSPAHRVFCAWAVGLRSPSLPLKQHVCAELSRLLDGAIIALDRAQSSKDRGGGLGKEEVIASAVARADLHLRLCLDALPVERLQSLARRRMLKEAEDEPMLSRVLQAVLDLVATADLAGRVLRERDDAKLSSKTVGERKTALRLDGGQIKETAPACVETLQADVDADHKGLGPGNAECLERESRSVVCLPSPSAYVALGGRDLEPPWTAEFWVFREEGGGGGQADKDRDKDKASTPPPQQDLSHGSRAWGPPDILGQRSTLLPGGGVRKVFSDGGSQLGLEQHEVATPPQMERAFSNSGGAVDLNQLPPTSPCEAPSLFRTRAVDTVGRDTGDRGSQEGAMEESEGSRMERVAPRGRGRGGSGRTESSTSTSSSPVPVPVRVAAPQGLRPHTGVMARSGVGEGTGALLLPCEDFLESHPASLPPSVRSNFFESVVTNDASGPARPRTSWGHRLRGVHLSNQTLAQSGGVLDSGKGVSLDAKDGEGQSQGTGSKSVKRDVVPSEYLASSEGGHIKLQLGGMLFSPSTTDKRIDGNGSVERGLWGKKVIEDQGQENDQEEVPSEALCVSMSASGEKDRVFDYVVPRGRWVHLALVASRHTDSVVTLYADGIAVNSMTLCMSLPMGCLGAGPRAQEVVASSNADGGSFVGRLASVRYWRYARTAGELQRDMKRDVSGTKGLVGLWGLDEGQGSAVTDWTDNHASCLITGGGKWEDCTGAPLGPIRGHGRWELLAAVGLCPDFDEGGKVVGKESGEKSLCKVRCWEDKGTGFDLLLGHWGIEGDGVVEMTGTLTCNPVQGVEGFWIRPSRQIVTLRFRHSLISKDPKDREKRGEDTIAVEGTLELPEEQATTEFSGWVGGTTDSMTLEGVAGEIIQGVPERVGWMSGATISGNFCKDGVEGKLMGVWSAKAHATKMRPLGPGGMRINVGLLPDRLVASQGIVDSSEGRDGIKPLTEPVGKRGGMHQSSDCRYICVVGGGNGDNSTSTVGHGFSALSFGPALGTAALASVEVYPHFGGHDDPSFPDSITWGNDLTPDENVVTVVDSSVSKGQYVKTLTTPHGQSPPPPLPSTSATVDAEAALDPVPLQVPGSSGVIATDGVSSNTGYVRGTWLWEWRILCCTSRMTVGICSYVVANRAGAPQIPSGGTEGGNSGDNIGSSDAKTVGDSKDLWGYRSDGYFVRGTEASESPCPGGGFESGDVVGVELDIDAGSVCFLKNGYYVGDKVLGVGQSESCKAQGVLPCISLRCGGDSALLLGLKEGEGALIHKVVEEAKGDTAEEGVGGEEAAGEDAGDEIFQGGGARQEEVGVRRGGELEEGDGHGEVVDEQKA
ncbi:unnamed protein product, partial [Choristocarpus tenellus]